MIESVATGMTFVFLIIIMSYYVLLFWPEKKPDYHTKFKSISIIIPARNEEQYIADCIASVKKAKFDGSKQIIVVNDASIDTTKTILQSIKGITVITNVKHSGKSDSLNSGLKRATGELIAIVDGDSEIQENALVELANELSRKNVAAGASVVRVKNRLSFINMWVHIDLIYGSLLRSIFSKVHANIITPGPLSMYRKSALDSIGGFSTKGFSEDIDVAVRLVRKGYHIGFSNTAISQTNMPDEVKGFFRQRTRMARGMVYVLKKNLRFNRAIIDLYTLPLFLFTYLQAIIMGSIIIWQISLGYWTYYVSQGVYFNLSVIQFLFGWLSIYGTLNWVWTVITTNAWTLGNIVGVSSTLLTYPLFLIAIIRYDKRIDIWHIIPLTFMFPFWFLLMIIYMICTPEIFMQKQYNRWKKNE